MTFLVSTGTNADFLGLVLANRFSFQQRVNCRVVYLVLFVLTNGSFVRATQLANQVA